MEYPGNCASPREMALWAKSVSEEEFGITGLLPIMCSATEITSAWTEEGCLEDIPGYLYSTDHYSVGLFQQQYDGNPSGVYFGWGTYDQCIDAEYALRRFLREATIYKNDYDQSDPQELGQWCQRVQRSAYPDRYYERGYPIARDLTAGLEDTPTTPDEWPQQEVGVSTDGWAYVKSGDGGRLWLRGLVGDEFNTDTEGWVKRTGVNPIPVPAPPEPDKKWAWPVANAAPMPDSYWYVERHPTRYDTSWRSDVEAWARYLVDKYPGQVWVNTYYDHPEGYGRDADSMDVWGYSGRGYAIDTDLGNRIFQEVFNDPGLPNIDWCIWQATIYGAWNSWYGESFGEDDFTWHYDHLHFTYL